MGFISGCCLGFLWWYLYWASVGFIYTKTPNLLTVAAY